MLDALAITVTTSSVTLAVVGLLALVWSLRTDLPHTSKALRAGAVLVFLIGVVLRWSAPAGPNDINMHAHSELSPFQSNGWGYGIAWGAIVRPLLTLWAGGVPNLDQLIALQFAVGIFAPLGVIAALRWAGLSERISWLAGLLVAIDPLLVRFGHTDSPQNVEIALWWIGLAAWLAHGRDPRLWRAALGTSAVSLAAMMRPEAILLLPVTALIVASLGRFPSLRRADTWLGSLVMVVVPGLHVLGMWLTNDMHKLSATGWEEVPGIVMFGPRALVMFNPFYTPWALQVLGVLGVLVAPLSWRRRLGLGVTLFVVTQFVPTWTWTPIDREVPCLLRHQIRGLPVFDVLVALAVGGLASRVRSARPTQVFAVLATLAIALRFSDAGRIWRAYTIHEEYAYFHEIMPLVPKDCMIVSFATQVDSGATPPLHLWSDKNGPYARKFLDQLRPGELRGCVYWYRPAICDVTGAISGDDMACYDFEATHELEPVSERWLPADPWLFDTYRYDPVRVGLYKVLGPFDPPAQAPQQDASEGTDRLQPMR